MKKINVSIIGAGLIAEEHIKAFASFKNFNFVGIHSRTKSKAIKLKKKYKIKKFYETIDGLYKNSCSDMVIVAINLDNISTVYKKVVSFDWVCLLEKPLGINYSESIKILKRCKDPKKIFVGLNRFSFSTTKKIIEYLDKDSSKRNIHIYDQENNYHIKNKKIKKNWMYCNSIHLVDYCRFLTRGKLTSVSIIKKDDKLNFIKLLKFSSGDRVVYTSIWNQPGPWSVKISTKNFFFDLIDLENLYIRSLKNKQKFSLNNNEIKYKPGFKKQARELKNYILNKKYPNLPNVLEANKTMFFVKKIYE